MPLRAFGELPMIVHRKLSEPICTLSTRSHDNEALVMGAQPNRVEDAALEKPVNYLRPSFLRSNPAISTRMPQVANASMAT